MANTVINEVVANGSIYANGFYGTGLANAYAFRAQSFAQEVGGANNRFVDVYNVNLATFSPAQSTLYFYNYNSADRVEIYQGNTLVAETGNAVALTTSDRAKLLSDQYGQFFNDSPDLYLKDFVLSTVNAKTYATYAGKITWTHNPSGGAQYTVRTSKGNGSFDWRWVLEYPIDGLTVGCPPLPQVNPPPPPPPVIYTPSGDGGGCGCKVACTQMNETYGFGTFRQKIWLAQSSGLDPAYQKGYHAIFIPWIEVAYSGEDKWWKKIMRTSLEEVARHRTADIWKQKRGKRDPKGATYRAIFEPIMFHVGKRKKDD